MKFFFADSVKIQVLLAMVDCQQYTEETSVVGQHDTRDVHGSDVHTVNETYETALFTAIHEGQKQCVNRLLEAGADVNVTNEQNETALFITVRK